MEFLEKIEKVQKWLLLVFFGLNLAMFLTFQSYDFDAVARGGTFGYRMTVENFMEIVCSFREIGNFHWSGENVTFTKVVEFFSDS